MGHGQGDGQDGIGPQAPFVRRAVQVQQPLVYSRLLRGVHSPDHLRDGSVDVGDGIEDPKAAEPGGVAVAQLHSFVGAGAGAGRDGGPPDSAIGQEHMGLQGRVAPRVQNFAGLYSLDRSHGDHPLLRPKRFSASVTAFSTASSGLSATTIPWSDWPLPRVKAQVLRPITGTPNLRA